MQDTLRAMVHSFVDHIKITNTNHPPASALLRRIATFYFTGLVQVGPDDFGGEYYSMAVSGVPTCFDLATDLEAHHLPEQGTLLGALDLVAFCFLVIFGNVFDFRTYTDARGEPLQEVEPHNQNGIALEERVNICLARGVCLELLRWWESKYSAITHTTPDPSDTAFTTRLLVAQAATLLKYKQSAEKEGREGALGCTSILLSHEVDNVLSIIPGGQQEWERVHNTPNGVGAKLGYNTDEWAHIEIKEREPQYYREYDLIEVSGFDLIPP